MNWKRINLSVIVSSVYILFLSQKYDFAVIINGTTDVNITGENRCDLPDGGQAFCVSIHNCLYLLRILNDSSLRARQCGPSNEDKKSPHVCCEKYFIRVARTTTPATTTTTTFKSTHNLGIENAYQERVPQKPEQIPKEKDTYEYDYEICGAQDIDQRIVGGLPSTQREFPWLARLLYHNNQGGLTFLCAGSLITSKVVLTSAHCLVSKKLVQLGDLYAVSLGDHETKCTPDADECLSNKELVIVSGFVVYPQYNISSKNHDHDIGLITLRDKVKFTDYIKPICLMENNTIAQEFSVAGWGKTETGIVSGVKLKTSLPTFAWEQCAEKFRTVGVELTPHQICAGGVEGKDACQGDSGGPLMVEEGIKWYVAGVVSFGFGCGRKGWPGIYIYVPNYVKWIKEHIRRSVPQGHM